MKIVYALEDFPRFFSKSLFLAGPTPRSKKVKSWRPRALKILEKKGYDGVVFVPESRHGHFEGNQTVWEDKALNMADCILFWIPRNLKTLPGFTTNHEHGEWFKSGKIVLGAPRDAPKMHYLRFKAQQFSVPQAITLKETIDIALRMIRDGALRSGGECQVPLYIWRTKSFQNWYQAQKGAGNRLDRARVEWVIGPKRKFVFCWVLHVDVYITKEKRHKVNEVVVARPDISTVLMYKRGAIPMDSLVVLVREFRSPVANESGYVWELPGGSSFPSPGDPLVVATNEVQEETGLRIDASRIKPHGIRQLAATFLAHKAHLFSVEITEDELTWLRQQKGIVHGAGGSERTYVEIRSVKEIIKENLVDWSMLGMILSVLSSSN